MKIFIHIGVHKTASTLIQHSIKLNSTQLRNISTIVRDTHPVIKNSLRRYLNGNPIKDEVTKKFNKLLQDTKNSNKETILISDENLLGAPASVYFMNDKEQLFYPTVSNRLRRLQSLFKDHDTTYIIYTRKQETLIPSLYLDGLKYFRYHVSMDDFLQRCLQDDFSFSNLLLKFNNKKVKVKPFETIKKGSHSFLVDFWRTIGYHQNVRDVKSSKVNTAINALEANIYQAIAKTNPSEKQKKQYQQWLKVMPKDSNNSCKIVPSLNRVAEIRNLYKNDVSYRKTN